MTDHLLRSRLAALTLEQKVRLLTGADFWGAARRARRRAAARRDLRRPGRRARRALGRARPVGQRPVADRARGDVGRGAHRAARPPARRRVPAQGRRRAARADGQPAPHPVRRPPLRVPQRGPAADRAHRRRVRARPAVGGVGATVKHFVANDSETERFSLDAQVDERTLRELYLAPFEAIVRDARRVGGDGRLQRRQRPHDDREPAAARRAQGRVGLRRRSSCPTGSRRARPRRAGRGGARPGDARPARPLGRRAGGRRARRARRRSRRSTTRCCGPAAGRPRRRARRRRPAGRPAPWSRRARSPRSCAATAAAGFVLARNERRLLPLDADALRRVAVVGPNAAVARTMGGGSATVFPPCTVSPLDGLRDALGDRRRGRPRRRRAQPHARIAVASRELLGGRRRACDFLDAGGAVLGAEDRHGGAYAWEDPFVDGVPAADVAAVEIHARAARDRGRRPTWSALRARPLPPARRRRRGVRRQARARRRAPTRSRR